MNGIIRVPTLQTVVVFCTGEVKAFFDEVFPAQLAVVKVEVIAAVVIAVEVIFQRDPVIAAISLNYKVIAFTCKGCFLCLRTLKAQRVRLFVVVSVVCDGIFAMTDTELVGIAFNSTTFQMVITSATIKRVMSGSAVEVVVAFVAVQNVIAAITA